jgi:hypothetical protein
MLSKRVCVVVAAAVAVYEELTVAAVAVVCMCVRV